MLRWLTGKSKDKKKAEGAQPLVEEQGVVPELAPEVDLVEQSAEPAEEAPVNEAAEAATPEATPTPPEPTQSLFTPAPESVEDDSMDEDSRLRGNDSDGVEEVEEASQPQDDGVEQEEESEPAVSPEPTTDPTPTESRSWFGRLTDGLSKSSSQLTRNLRDVFTKSRLDTDTLQELEDALIMADLGVTTAAKFVEDLSRDRFDKEVDEGEIRDYLAAKITDVLTPVAQPLALSGQHRPEIILMVGVNGTGKTTTIGKLAQQLHDDGKTVMMAAGDTFRAAAIEQLQAWGARTNTPVVTGPSGGDAAALAFDALQQARAQNVDVLLVDTAGRLHNKQNLMEELAKIVRVLKKQDETAPHHVLLTLDATTGQNAYAQMEAFQKMVGVTGLIITKLDGSAKGGVVVGLADKFQLPIHAIGVGESVEDLHPFKPEDFARALVG